MYEFSESKYYPKLREDIIDVITTTITNSGYHGGIYNLVFEKDFESKLKEALRNRITEELIVNAISECGLGPAMFIYDLNLKKYWQVMNENDRETLRKETRFYKSPLYGPFDKVGTEDEAEAFYGAFHCFFRIPALVIYERVLHTFLPNHIIENVKVYFKNTLNPEMKQVLVEEPWLISNILRLNLTFAKDAIADIIEVKWVLLYVEEFTVSFFPIEPGTPSLN